MEGIFKQFRSLVTLPDEEHRLSVAQHQAILNQHEPFFRLSFTEQPKGIKASEWFELEFPIVLQSYADSINTKLPFAVPIWQKVFNAILFTSMVAQRVVFDRVLKLSLDDIYLTIGEDHRVAKVEVLNSIPLYSLNPSDALNSLVLDSAEELDEKLAEVIATLSNPLVASYKKQKVSPKVFWGNILYACDLAFSKLVHQPIATSALAIDEQSVSNWQQRLFNAVIQDGGNLNSVKKVEFNGFQKLYVRRETCCLKYKIDGKEKCSTCNLHNIDIQENIMRKKLLKELEQAAK